MTKILFLSGVMRGWVDEKNESLIFICFDHVFSVLGWGLWNLYGRLDKQYQHPTSYGNHHYTMPLW